MIGRIGLWILVAVNVVFLVRNITNGIRHERGLISFARYDMDFLRMAWALICVAVGVLILLALGV